MPDAASLARTALNAILPARCMLCGALVAEDGALCAACWDGIHFQGPPACACCGYTFKYGVPSESLCGACQRHPPLFDWARAVFAYDDASRSLILSFKHADQTHLSLAFGCWLSRAGEALIADADLLLPVPLRRLRLFAGRLNQAALLAHALSRESGKPVAADLPRRRRRTASQGRMSRSARIRNVRGGFAVREEWREQLRGARVLLLDDVQTTGATVEECARILKRSGPAGVDVLTLARVIWPQS